MSNDLREQIIDVIEEFTGRNVDDNAVGDAIMTHVANHVAAERERLAVRFERTRDEMYPTDVFGGPISTDESREACRLLRENGLPQYDTVGATAMRHAYTRAALIARSGGES